MYRSRIVMVTTAVFAVVLAFGSLLASGAFSGSGAAPVASAQQQEASEGTISVTGEGQVTQVPDAASAVVGVEVTGDDLSEVLADANERMDAVISSIIDQNIPEENIQTEVFSIRVERDRDMADRPITGYTVVNMVRVTVTPIEQIANVIDEAVDAGANQVGNIGFAVEDRDAAIRQAREQAMSNAREKAEHFAELGDVSLGPVVSISETGTAPPPPRPVADVAVEAPETPIEPGEEAVSVTVEVVYSIE
jgi:uncharacterized protein